MQMNVCMHVLGRKNVDRWKRYKKHVSYSIRIVYIHLRRVLKYFDELISMSFGSGFPAGAGRAYRYFTFSGLVCE